jgi:hypothetical protein
MPGGTEDNNENVFVRRIRVLDEVQTQHFPNIPQKLYG